MFERQIRTEIVAVLPANTTAADYGYGPFRQHDKLFPEIPGIVVSSPLWDYNPRKKQFRLCWSGYESSHPDWDSPSICDKSRRDTSALARGLTWIPQNSWEGSVDNLVTLSEYDNRGHAFYKYITVAKLDDGTIMMDFNILGQGGEGLPFEFRDISSEQNPGTKTMSVAGLQSWLYWGRRTTEWERKTFYVCDHPDYGRSVFLANPYTLTTNKRAWGTIPCQVCNLQAQYWFEDKRQRFVRPLAERINNLGRRDYEDPLNISNNFYRVTHRNIPRRVRFVDEDGELEPRWTPRELADRVASEQRGVEYVRPYILLRRQRRRAAQMAAMQMAPVEEQTGVTMDTLTNVDAQSSEQPEQRRQRQSDALFEELIRTIDSLDDTNEAHMAQVPLDDDERAEGDLVVVDVDAQRNALDRTLNSVLGTGNLIVLLGLMRSRNGSLGLGDIHADVLRDLQLRLGNEIGGSGQPGRQRQIGRIQEVAGNSEDGLDDAAGNSEVGPDDAAENTNSNVDRSDGAADQEDPAEPVEAGVASGVNARPSKSTGQRCGNIRPEQRDFREPVEVDFAGSG
ncbi:hypothetical protein TWF102_006935 [Orbilia oligospora]|uniref:Uncharacterized protein n=1 Tax=Orbilia oligospora TaxID=2813651 RepID=A0A7C8NVM1_ORBOL|nr:hypothetical protein TWF103_005807 [Orbilia oligospora]KAF3111262.1 hypothetical protein TWF102_006935 [Orbilia oligospora]KAF3114251.1 hypothetical protein TWF706_008188 [Orbilia oligospora]